MRMPLLKLPVTAMDDASGRRSDSPDNRRIPFNFPAVFQKGIAAQPISGRAKFNGSAHGCGLVRWCAIFPSRIRGDATLRACTATTRAVLAGTRCGLVGRWCRPTYLDSNPVVCLHARCEPDDLVDSGHPGASTR